MNSFSNKRRKTFSARSRKFYWSWMFPTFSGKVEISVQLSKTSLDSDGIGNSLKTIIDSFIDGSSDHLLSVYVKSLFRFEEILVQNWHLKKLDRKILILRLVFSTSVIEWNKNFEKNFFLSWYYAIKEASNWLIMYIILCSVQVRS